jgi:hypothetical protein
VGSISRALLTAWLVGRWVPQKSKVRARNITKSTSIGAKDPSRPTLPPWWLSSSSESRPTPRWGRALSFSTATRSLVVVWCCCCLSPENVSVGPRSQSSPFCCFCFAAYTRSVSLLFTTASSRPCFSISPAAMLSLVTLSFSLLLSFATAQSTQVTWIEPGPSAGAFTYAGSVIDACPGTTVLALQCISGSGNAFTELCGTDAPVKLQSNATNT